MNIVHNRKQPSSRITAMVTARRQWKIGDVLLWRRSHVDGLKINRGFDAHAVEVHVESLPRSPAADVVQPAAAH
jgi:hypothetical protein